MRMRTIKPDFFANEYLAELSPLTRLLFAGLWCYVDREGRAELRPKRIKGAIFPYDECDVATMLSELESRGFIRKYSVGHVDYLVIPKFLEHQRPHSKEADSTIPSPPRHPLGLVPAPTLVGACTDLGSGEHAQSLGAGELDLGNGILNAGSVPVGPGVSKQERVTRKAATGAHAELLAWFVARYAETQRSPYHVTGKDGTLLARLLKIFSADELRVRAERLLTTDDTWIGTTDRGIGVLASQINKPVLRGIKPPSVKRDIRVGQASPSPASAFIETREVQL